MSGGLVVGVDIGGTKTHAAVVGPGGTIHQRAAAPTPAAEGPTAILETVTRLVREVCGTSTPQTVGIGSAGVIDAARGVVVSSTAALYDWAGTYIAQRLTDALRAPVTVDNDVNAFAYGELTAGAAVSLHNVLAIMVGTGIGAGITIDGRLLHGSHHTAGEIGHLPALGADGLPCACGASGHLEAIASGVAMEQRYAAATGQTPRLPDIAHLANHGDQQAARVITEGAQALGASLAGTVNLLDPEIVIIGGGVAALGRPYLATVEESYRAHLLPGVADVPAVASTLGHDAVLIGAAALGQIPHSPGHMATSEPG